ncbi:insulinase family protein [Paraflavitalea sp. CAU 1676]|uniref:M16 family metallopeptidase n=1 Tax=Paraflavitalea sp. CAU 1676 TaxID=3032598 RepID=UPI0023DAE4F6|nr:insulinase family protein [Paraflavitalea sp. CAU 1676]MDF2192550.1 insulinase family protein [Paraflavitalea sp. CAU 1676]
MNKPFKAIAQWLLILVVTITAGHTFAQNSPLDPTAKIPVDPKVKIGKLDNGLTFYIRQNKKPEQKVELRLVLNAGAINEDDDQQGLAHMAEHMAFNGTTHFKKNDIVSFLQNIGVGFGNDLNAYTSFDETVYILPIPIDKPGNLEKGFQVLEDWAHNVTYLDDDIQNEKPIILEESRLGKGANDRMFKKIYPQLFAGSKYAKRLPIGIDSIIKNFKPDVIRRFYKDWYRPNLMAVIVVGDIEPAKAEALVRKHFAGLTNPANPRPREYANVPAYASNEAMVVTDKEATSYTVSINYPAFKESPSSTVGDYRNYLVKQMFVSLTNQRLQELTQKENPPFLFGSVSFGSYARGYDAFGAFAAAGTGDVNKALSAVVEEIERVKRFGFTAAELERAKKSMLANYDRMYNNRDKTESDNYVEEYVNNFLQQEPIPGMDKEYEYAKGLVPGISLEEVNAVSKKFKDDKNRFVYVTGPEPKAGEKLPEGKDLLAAIEAKEKADIKPYEEKAVAATLISKEPAAGKVVAKTKNAALGTTELKLSNGITVTLKSTDFKNDQILMGATRQGGKNSYGLSDKFNAEYAVPLVSTMGVGEFSPTDLRKALAGKTASVNPTFSAISEGVRGNSSVKDLETMFQLTYLYFTAPRKDTALFRSWQQRNKSQFANISANPQAVFFDTLNKTMYNNNPLAPVMVPNSSYFDQVNLDRALDIYKERFGDASGMSFTFVGSFKDEEIIPYIEKYIASLPATGKKFAFVDNKVRPVTGNKQLTVNKGKEEKSMILAFYSGEVPYTEDMDLKAQAMSEVLNIRIIEELREKVQGIYGGGTNGGLEKYPYTSYSFVLQLPCGPEKVDTLLKAVKKEFVDIVAKGPDTSYLNKVKIQWLEQNKVKMKENGTWLEGLMSIKFKGDDPDRFLHAEKYINKLTPKDVQQAAKLILDGKNQFYAIQMPENYGNKTPGSGEQKKGF